MNFPPYRLRLEGAAELRNPTGEIVSFRTRKAILLLAVLAANPDGVARAELAAQVWDEASPEAARASLRTALVGFRTIVPDLIVVTPETIAIAPAKLVVEPEEGEFMPGFDELWALDERLRRRAETVESLLLAAESSEGDVDALRKVEKACAIDPFHARAEKLRERILQRTGRAGEAIQRGDQFQARFVREFGAVANETVKPPQRAEVEHPLVTTAEWTLARDPDEACSLLAGTQLQWATVSVDRALEIHERTLHLSRRPGRDRDLVESWTWCLRVMNGNVGPEMEPLIQRHQEALDQEEPLVAARLTDALAYANLSRGAFTKALAYARKGAQLARRRQDPLGIAAAEMTLSIIEQHAGAEGGTQGTLANRSEHRAQRALRLAEEFGGLTVLAMHEILQTGALIRQGKYDAAFVLIERCRRTAETLSAGRMQPWIIHLEGELFEETGDLHRARQLFEELRAHAAQAGQAAVALADDSLFRVNCKLGELDTAAEALARGTVYRRRMGTVPSRFEHAVLAPSVRVIRDRLDPRDLAAAFRKARATH